LLGAERLLEEGMGKKKSGGEKKKTAKSRIRDKLLTRTCEGVQCGGEDRIQGEDRGGGGKLQILIKVTGKNSERGSCPVPEEGGRRVEQKHQVKAWGKKD